LRRLPSKGYIFGVWQTSLYQQIIDFQVAAIARNPIFGTGGRYEITYGITWYRGS
jgi:hypothetical protein